MKPKTKPTKATKAGPKRKPTIEDWQVQDAKRLSDLWEKKYSNGRSQGDLAAQAADLGIDLGNQANISHYMTGKQPLNFRVAVGFARVWGCRVDAFSPRLARTMLEWVSFAKEGAPIIAADAIEVDLITMFRNLHDVEDQKAVIGNLRYLFNKQVARKARSGKNLHVVPSTPHTGSEP